MQPQRGRILRADPGAVGVTRIDGMTEALQRGLIEAYAAVDVLNPQSNVVVHDRLSMIGGEGLARAGRQRLGGNCCSRAASAARAPRRTATACGSHRRLRSR